jgi:hypothetical protein
VILCGMLNKTANQQRLKHHISDHLKHPYSHSLD